MNIAADVNQCFRKRVYRNPKVAQKTADRFNNESPPPDGKVFHVYSCPVCFNFHVGRTNPERKEK